MPTFAKGQQGLDAGWAAADDSDFFLYFRRFYLTVGEFGFVTDEWVNGTGQDRRIDQAGTAVLTADTGTVIVFFP